MTDLINAHIYLIEAMIKIGFAVMAAGLMYVTAIWTVRKWD